MRTDDAEKKQRAKAWRRRWLQLPSDARREVTKAVHEGRAVHDPDLAPMAMELAAIRLGRKDGPRFEYNAARSQRRVAWCYAGLALLFLLDAIIGPAELLDHVFGALWGTAAGATWWTAARNRRHYEQSHKANATLRR